MLTAYLNELQHVELLTLEEEQDSWRRYRVDGDAASRLRLIEAYQPLVFKVVMQVRPPDRVLMDMIQEGTIGLIEAVERFDPWRGVRFSTFATYRIRGRVLNSLRRDHRHARALPLGGRLIDPAADAALTSVEDAAMLVQVRHAIDALPDRERAIVRATYVESRPPRSVAAELRISLSHFYRLQKQAIDRMRRLVLEETHQPGRVHGY